MAESRPGGAGVFSRREFLLRGGIGGAGLVLAGSGSASAAGAVPSSGRDGNGPSRLPLPAAEPANRALDLTPARWIWYPSGRTLPNTMVLFRKALDLPARPVRAQGWILGESRYKLNLNGSRLQWGPAPSDPRWTEVDPLDLAEGLQAGRNVIGAQVLFYGHGDGTWPAGKPGFLFRLELDFADGSRQLVVSDETWQAHLARAWPPGQYKRWYLRALQEEFDARVYPFGWTRPDQEPTGDWLPAMVLGGRADKPAIANGYPDYLNDTGVADPEAAHLRPRSTPMLLEHVVPAARLNYSLWIEWQRPPEEYFELRVPDAFVADRTPSARQTGVQEWRVELDGRRSAALTFEFDEQIVGWPLFEADAPEGTIIEVMIQEGHAPGGPALLNTHFHAWSRFVCRAGTTRFEAFDYESLRWMQLLVRNATGPVTLRDVGVRRRQFPWPALPDVECSDERIQKLADAAVNTLHNAAQETIVDGMGRERQQYSGDVGHTIHAIHQAFGERRIPARFVRTFSHGLTLDGYFLDTWPAYDRLARIAQRQLGLTPWGPILDHGIGFNFDCWYHYLYSGNRDDLDEAYPRLLRFFQYLTGLQREDRLLPVEDLGVPTVWIDHSAYRQQRHKQCAFNLYAAGMAEHALAPLCRAFGDHDWEADVRRFSASLLAATTERFWSEQRGMFVDNLPWTTEEGGQARLSDRSLAMSILFEQCPGGRTGESLGALADPPPELGLSFPGNANWKLWALGKGGRVDALLADLRTRWWAMESVHRNNTLQEDWHVSPDSTSQWSHIPVAPLFVLYMNIAGIRPLAPGYARYEMRPQPADLERLALTYHTRRGPVHFRSTGRLGSRLLEITAAPSGDGVLLLDSREAIGLERLREGDARGLSAYRLSPGTAVSLELTHT
jgi:alpha-L-rhamnosidase